MVHSLYQEKSFKNVVYRVIVSKLVFCVFVLFSDYCNTLGSFWRKMEKSVEKAFKIDASGGNYGYF